MDLNQLYTTILAALPSLTAVITVISTAVKIKNSVNANKDSTISAIKGLTKQADEQIKATKLENESLKAKINTLASDNAALRSSITALTKTVSKVCDKIDTKE